MNTLVHLKEFEEALRDYRISRESLHTLQQTEMVLLVAPTSSGRNTIIRQLLKTGDYYYVVSDTTRNPRTNDGIPEQNGVEYWFRSEEEMLNEIQQGVFLEAAVIHEQQVSGMSIREIAEAGKRQKIALTEVDISGAASAARLKPDTLAIFVLPPNFEEWQRRLKHRGAMEADEFRRRMQSAQKEFAAALEHDYYRFIINDTVEHAVEQVHMIAKMGEVDGELQTKARDLTEQLYIETSELLKTLKIG